MRIEHDFIGADIAINEENALELLRFRTHTIYQFRYLTVVVLQLPLLHFLNNIVEYFCHYIGKLFFVVLHRSSDPVPLHKNDAYQGEAH